MNPVLIIVAMRFEADRIINQLTSPTPSGSTVFPYVEGIIGSRKVAVCVGGVGKINAGAATAAMIERLSPQLVINTGCAGAYYGSGLSVGDLIIASEEFLGDEGAVTSAGWLDLRGMDLPYLASNSLRCFNDIPLSQKAVESVLAFAHSCGVHITSGRFITVSTCSGSRKQGEEMVQRCSGVAENMEGAAVALTCLRYGIECLEVRGISNMVDERNLAEWDIKLAVNNAQEFVLNYLKEM